MDKVDKSTGSPRAAELAADRAFAEDHQDGLARISDAQRQISRTGSPSIPFLPIGRNEVLSHATRTRQSSREYGLARAETAKAIKPVRAQHKEMQKRVETLIAQVKAAQVKLDTLSSQPGEKIEERVLQSARLDTLAADLLQAQRQAAALQESISLSEKTLHDNMVQWAEARRDYCESVMPILAKALAEANEILEWKAAELEGKVRK